MRIRHILIASILLVSGFLILNLLQNLTDDKIVYAPISSYNHPLLLEGRDAPMSKPLNVLLQYVMPQRALSVFAGMLATSEKPQLKNTLIRYFLSRYDVNMAEAAIENPYEYASFNSFFTRHLKSAARPIASDPEAIISPADGFISQIGKMNKTTLLQAKGFTYDLTSLLGGSKRLADEFRDGSFATIYLSPKDYHRVHMPFAGKLRETIFIPGKLFSVNQQTTTHVPDLFARNERLVCIFDTKLGPMAIILVGAMLVGSIETSWHTNTRATKISIEAFNHSLAFDRAAELGYFKMGSTVIVLFGKDKLKWLDELSETTRVQMGSTIGDGVK